MYSFSYIHTDKLKCYSLAKSISCACMTYVLVACVTSCVSNVYYTENCANGDLILAYAVLSIIRIIWRHF